MEVLLMSWYMERAQLLRMPQDKPQSLYRHSQDFYNKSRTHLAAEDLQFYPQNICPCFI